ncbi:MAG: ATP-binding cassette domain-containing protein [Synergistaceae bacterium]|jgi:energy-coupling factor transport system ATP-binding protein|nr:ATP-binding cassette domain-containing protein [Synergistaceae bacterium]
MDQKSMFSIRAAAYSYSESGTPALDGVDLEIEQGEWVALVGANGSGKSTLAKICNALLAPTQGTCFVMGLDASDPQNTSAIRQNVALVFQNPEDQIVASIVEEDVAFGPENLGLPPDEIRRRVDRALLLTDLELYRARGSYSLSGGQKQRLALAGALALEPDALLLDESTSMLDPEGRDSFLSCLGELNRRGMTILQITHRMEEAALAGRIVVMESGRVAWDGPPPDFFDGGYLRWSFEEPPEMALHHALLTRGLIPQGTKPGVEDMLEALCL